jgi:hypothetical protein
MIRNDKKESYKQSFNTLLLLLPLPFLQGGDLEKQMKRIN